MAIDMYQYGDNRGYIAQSDTVYGEEQGYYFIVRPQNDTENYVMHFSIEYVEGSDLQSKLRDALFEYKDVLTTTYNHTGLDIVLALPSRDYYAILDEVCNVLKDVNIPQVCAYSKSKENLGVYNQSGNVIVLNEKTFIESDKSLRNRFGFNQDKFLLGILVGFVYSLLGLALWVGLSYVNIVASMAGYAIVYLSFKGYQKVAGRLTKKAIITLLILDSILVILSEPITYIIGLMTSGDNLVEAIQIFQYGWVTNFGGIQNSVMINTLLGFVFFGLGSFRLIKSQLQYSDFKYESEKLL